MRVCSVSLGPLAGQLKSCSAQSTFDDLRLISGPHFRCSTEEPSPGPGLSLISGEQAGKLTDQWISDVTGIAASRGKLIKVRTEILMGKSSNPHDVSSVRSSSAATSKRPTKPTPSTT